MKALQIFSDEALERGKQLSTNEILRFLEEFRLLYGNNLVEQDDRINGVNLTQGINTDVCME